MIGRRELVSHDVHGLVFECLDLIEHVQTKLGLPICLNLRETREKLKGGVFKVEPFIPRKAGNQKINYALFKPPSTIILDSRISHCDGDKGLPELPVSLAYYSITHEVLQADDYTGGEVLRRKTIEHILRDHQDKLQRGMLIIERNGDCDCIPNQRKLAELWAMQYVDMAAHYRAFVVLRHRQLPRLDLIWAHLKDDPFSPRLLTYIERHRGAGEVFDIITRRAGEYCLIEALKESQSISEKNACSYTV